MAWVNRLTTSVMLIDISQFYPSINHEMMVKIMGKQGFNKKICKFFKNYLTGRKTTFLFGEQKMAPIDFNTGVGQRSGLSPILSELYIGLVIHKWYPVQNDPK